MPNKYIKPCPSPADTPRATSAGNKTAASRPGKAWIWAVAALALTAACMNRPQPAPQLSTNPAEVPVCDTIRVTSDAGSWEHEGCDASTCDFVVLQEDDNTLFAEINQVIDTFGKYFIVDTYGARKVVSFDHQGRPLAAYGERGNGPGEYIQPWDVDVSSKYVYILDISQMKLLKYTHEGDFVDSRQVPFESRGFALLNDHRILFNISSLDKTKYQLCITDSALNPLKYLLSSPDEYVGGWVTNDVFLKNKGGISYYRSPADTIYRLDNDGHLTGKRLLQFEKGPVDASAQLDFTQARERGKLTHGMHLLNNPMELPDGTCFLEITDYADRGAYVMAWNPRDRTHRTKKFADKMSVYDVIVPCATNGNNQIISYLDRELAGKCHDFGQLPDSLVQALNEGNRLLVIHHIH